MWLCAYYVPDYTSVWVYLCLCCIVFTLTTVWRNLWKPYISLQTVEDGGRNCHDSLHYLSSINEWCLEHNGTENRKEPFTFSLHWIIDEWKNDRLRTVFVLVSVSVVPRSSCFPSSLMFVSFVRLFRFSERMYSMLFRLLLCVWVKWGAVSCFGALKSFYSASSMDPQQRVIYKHNTCNLLYCLNAMCHCKKCSSLKHTGFKFKATCSLI